MRTTRKFAFIAMAALCVCYPVFGATPSDSGTTVVSEAKDSDRQLTYSDMKSFVERYFHGYGDWVNSADTIDELDNYYTPEFTSTVYGFLEGMPYPFVRKDRQTFKESLVRLHADIAEVMTPTDIWIDVQRKKATALVKVQMTNRKTGAKMEVDMAAFYQLCLDANHTIKFESVGVFLSDPERASKFYLKHK